jgi:hypothetical protein
MPDIQTDLCKVAGNLDAAFPEHAPIVLFATAQERHIDNNVISSLFADYSGRVRCNGPVIEKAYAILLMLGYGLKWHEGAKMAYAVSGSAKGLCAHERIGLRRIQ